MSTKKPHTRSQAKSDRTNLYDEITYKIIGELEGGRVPWVQPWGTEAAKAPLAMPNNAATDRGYSGINILILWGAVIEHGFLGQSWLTFRQALSLGGNVRKGERGTTVVYADRFIPDDEKRRASETGDDAQAIPFLKRFTVFNAAQCETLPKELAVALSPPESGSAMWRVLRGATEDRGREWQNKRPRFAAMDGCGFSRGYIALTRCVQIRRSLRSDAFRSKSNGLTRCAESLS